jgi:hypothetical protein
MPRWVTSIDARSSSFLRAERGRYAWQRASTFARRDVQPASRNPATQRCRSQGCR